MSKKENTRNLVSSVIVSNEKKLIEEYINKNISSLKDYFKGDIFQEKIEFNIKNTSVSLINAIRHAFYKEDYIYYLDCEFNDISFETDDDVYIHRDIIKQRLNSIPIKVYNEELFEKYISNYISIGNLKVRNNYTKQFLDVFAHSIILTKDFQKQLTNNTSLFNNFRITQLPYSLSTFSINNIYLKKGYSKDNTKNINLTAMTFIPTYINDENDFKTNITGENSSSNKDYDNYNVVIETSGMLDIKKNLLRIVNLLILKFKNLKQSLIDKDEKLYIYNPVEKSFVFYNEDYILENLILHYGVLQKLTPICHVDINSSTKVNVSVKNISDKKLIELFDTILFDLENIYNIFIEVFQ